MVVLITGTTSGIGKETAKLLSKQGHIVYGTSRKTPEDTITKVDQYYLINLDLANTNTIDKTVNTIIKKEGKIDVLINNAGLMIGGPIEFTSLDSIRKEFEINFFGTIYLIKKVLPYMHEKGFGKIISISSIGGVMGLPMQGIYASSKFALEGFIESLNLELLKTNIKFSIVEPGDIKTNVVQNRIKSNIIDNDILSDYNFNIENINHLYKKHYEQLLTKTMKIIEHEENNGLSPVIVANTINKILKKNNPKLRYIVADPLQKLSVVLKKILPDNWFKHILKLYYKL